MFTDEEKHPVGSVEYDEICPSLLYVSQDAFMKLSANTQ